MKMPISNFGILLITIVTAQATVIFQSNGEGCKELFDEESSFLSIDTTNNTSCDWAVQVKEDAIIMNIIVDINCTVGYLEFSDLYGGSPCGICESLRPPTEYCQIYMREGACTKDEIWRKVMSEYPFCEKSVIHRSLDDIHITLVNLTEGSKYFELEYITMDCNAATPLIPALGPGPAVVRNNISLRQVCPAKIPSLVTTPQVQSTTAATTLQVHQQRSTTKRMTPSWNTKMNKESSAQSQRLSMTTEQLTTTTDQLTTTTEQLTTTTEQLTTTTDQLTTTTEQLTTTTDQLTTENSSSAIYDATDENTVDSTAKPKEGFKIWWIIIIMASIFALLLLSTLIICLWRKRRQKKSFTSPEHNVNL